MSCITNSTCSSATTGTGSQIFTTALQFFAASQCLITPDWPPDAEVDDFEEFDFIIVGAGTSGCVLANRLSENENCTVLIIEAGDDPPIESMIPALDSALFKTKYDWQYETTNDGRSNQAHINGSINWPRGKMLGGSSSINAMMYVKGSRDDYEKWYDAGNLDWHPDVVQEYFNKAENFQNQDMLQNPEVNNEYGRDGPLVINRSNSTFRKLTENIIDSWDEIGIKKVVDLNAANNIGSGFATVTTANGIRQSSAAAYLNSVRDRPNLKVLKNALCTEIIINDTTKEAIGVKVEKNDKTLTFTARLEVIISAGAINTPQLLMLSGVGPRAHLESKNISCKVDSPMVGQNLLDHNVTPVTIYGNGPAQPDNATRRFDEIKYLSNRTGYLAQNGLIDIISFYSASKEATYPDYQNHISIFRKNVSDTRNAFSIRLRYNATVADHVVELNKKYTLFDFYFILLHPYSKGNISLNSNNPKHHPLIYANYFEDPRDLDAAVSGIKMLTEIVNTEYFKSIDAFVGRMKWPDCDKFELDSSDYWKCICLNMAVTCYHPVGTCKMGLDSETSVVSSELKVHGVKSLRVIDASIMPTITSGNTNGPATMIGERGADLVKRDYLCYRK